MKKIILIVLCAVLYGCAPTEERVATSENYQALLDEWLGHTKKELLSVWGTPSHDYWRGNKNYVIYVKSHLAKVAEGNKIERMPFMAEEIPFYKTDTATVNKFCNTIFVVQNKKIKSWRFDGNDCMIYAD